MKKLLLLILLPLSFYAYAEDTFSLNVNIATIGVGANFSDTDYNGELFVELLTVGLKHNYTNIGMGISPFRYWNLTFDSENIENSKQRLSFLNFDVNWDILYNKNLFLGPFCSINYFFIDQEKMRWNEYIFTAGLRFSWSFNLFLGNIFQNFLNAEIAYRNINGQNNLHFKVSIDILSLLFAIYTGGGYGYGQEHELK